MVGGVMRRKLVTAWVCSAIIFSFIVIVVEIAPRVEAPPTTIYVDDDYTVEDGIHKKTIQAAIDNASDGDTVFVYNGTYYENVVVNKTINLTGISRDNTTIDGGWGSIGIEVTEDYVNITGFTVMRASFGIYISWASNVTIIKNNVTICGEGIRLHWSPNSTIINNSIYRCGSYGIRIWVSSNHLIEDNQFVNSGVIIWGNELEHFNSHTIPNNIVNGKPLYYYKDTDGIIIDGIDVGQVILANCTNCSLKNLVINRSAVGIEVGFSKDIEIINNTVFDHSYGIWLDSCRNVNLSKNNITNNGPFGLRVDESRYINITNNNVSYNNDGIYLMSWVYWNRVENNNIFKNHQNGIELAIVYFNDIIANNVTSNNGYGIYVDMSNGNKIYHNNIIGNKNQAYDNTDKNTWNDSYPSGGNYWSDYSGPDKLWGPNQDKPGNDGIGDINYTIDLDSVDNYPLKYPFGDEIFLYQGWNLISIPLIQSDNHLDNVLYSIEGDYDAVRWFNASDTNDHWKQNSSQKPSYLNDLDKMDHRNGVWIHVTNPSGILLKYNGVKPTISQQIQLYKGWNLVGYPSLTSYNRTDGLNNTLFGTDINKVMWYDAASGTWHSMSETDYFRKGVGYWIHAGEDITWNVPL
jgi:parallel beta-helix repeat protein